MLINFTAQKPHMYRKDPAKFLDYQHLVIQLPVRLARALVIDLKMLSFFPALYASPNIAMNFVSKIGDTGKVFGALAVDTCTNVDSLGRSTSSIISSQVYSLC